MRVVSIYPDPNGRALLEKALGEREGLTLCRSFTEFPDADTLSRALRAWAPAIVFLDISYPAIEMVNAQLAADFPSLRRVAIHPGQDPDIFRRVLHLGMCELVNPPFRRPQFGPVLDRLITDVEQQPVVYESNCRISAFLPAKAGVGASTIAAHCSWAAAENQEARVLLMDFDRHSGITAFQFNVEADYTLSDALSTSMELDDESWRRLIRSKDKIDMLVSRPGDITDSSTERLVAPLIQFAQRNYTAIHADLPDTLDPHTLAVLHQADQIFIVATPELPALRLARTKAATLQRLDLEGRTRLVLNRVNHRLGLSLTEIENAVGMPIFATFTCDYDGVSESLRAARPASKLLKSARAFLAKSGTPPKRPAHRWKFLERISLPLASHQGGISPNVPLLRKGA